MDDTATLIAELTGGDAVLRWMGGLPNFGDAEILEINLGRKSSYIKIEVSRYLGAQRDTAVITFWLSDTIDVQIDGFSHQNVIGGLTLKLARETLVPCSLIGTGLIRGDMEIDFQPCFGAFGAIRARIVSIEMNPATLSE